MGQPMEDTEDEFVELAGIVKKYGRVQLSNTQTSDSRNAGRAPASISPMSGAIAPLKSPLYQGAAKISHEMPDLSKPRKRILKRICDNPLLRPVGLREKAATSASLLKKPILKLKIVSGKDDLRTKVTAGHTSGGHSGFETDEEISSDDSTGLSNFIVRDSSYLEEFDSEEDLKPKTNPQKPRKKLMRGRRQCKQELQLDRRAEPNNTLDAINTRLAPERITNGLQKVSVDSRKYRIEKTTTILKDNPTQCCSRDSSSDVEEPFAILSFSPPRQKSPERIPTPCFGTPPTSPKTSQVGLVSPKKLPRIPSIPHLQSLDTFWSQDVINEWNDEFSPRKVPETVPRHNSEKPIGSNLLFNPSCKNSPSKQCPSIINAKKSFGAKKIQIAESFLKEIDSEITGGKVSKMTSSTGGIKIIWSKKLNTTAGRANWKRETVKSKSLSLDQSVTHRHYASIELAEKVINDEDRLLNVLAHEFCHLANFMVSGIKNNPHGKEFKVWAAKCSQAFRHRGIEVTTKHSYVIDYKYVWECTNCGMEFKRHSKSIDIARHQCGSCKSKLIQTKPAPRNGAMSDYQIFMKENMKKIRENNPGSPQKEIMGLVAKQYQEYKASRLRGHPKDDLDIASVKEIMIPKEECPADINNIVRKLDFLSLSTA